MQKQKMMIVGSVVALLLIVVGGVGIYTFLIKKPADQTAQKTTTKKKKIDQYNVIAVADRPYYSIRPVDGKNIAISIISIKKPAESAEYELEYQAGELLQGAFGEVAVVTLPVEKKILLGSCSAGGACTYHTNVQGGSIVTRFSGANEYALKSDWRYIENKSKEKAIGSKDAKFQIESPEIAKEQVMIITNSPGYPGTLPGTPISDVYVLAATSKLAGQATVTIRGTQDASTARLAVYDGTNWKTVTGTATDKSLTAATPFGEAYVLVK